MRVWSTPGHTADSLSFLLTAHDGSAPAVLTGDTMLGRGTTVVAHPDGNLGDYLASLRRLQALGGSTVLPGHGPELPDAGRGRGGLPRPPGAAADAGAGGGRAAGPAMSLRAGVVEIVYADVDPVLWPAAELSVRAQLAYLRVDPSLGQSEPSRGHVSGRGGPAARGRG